MYQYCAPRLLSHIRFLISDSTLVRSLYFEYELSLFYGCYLPTLEHSVRFETSSLQLVT